MVDLHCTICIISGVGWLSDHHLLLLKQFGPYVIIFMNVRVVITVAMVWRSFAVKGFWALWDNIITLHGNAVKGGLLCTV
jgi:hypothetical protein